MNHREVMQQALDAIGAAYREHFVHTHGSTKNELQDAANAIRKELAKPEEKAVRDLEEAEQYIQNSIDCAPEPLKRLGEWLTNVLDENQWPHAERLLLGAIAAKPAAVPTDEAIVAAFKAAGMNTDIDQMPNMLYSVRGQLAQLINGARALLADQQPAAVPDGLPSDGTLPQHYVDGWNAARFAALGHPPALAVDVEAVRDDLERLIQHAAEVMSAVRRDDIDFANDSFRSLPDHLAQEIDTLAESISDEQYQLARAIGDET